MGKYMKKSKINGDIVVMEISHNLQSSMGVRTRARTLALQKLQQLQSQSSNHATPTSANDDSSGGYLQLRSRRLEKKSLPPLPGGGGDVGKRNPSSRLRISSVNSGSDGEVSVSCINEGGDEEFGGDLGGEEASFGENNLDFDARGRSTRESTPCSFIRDPENVATPPGSTTRPPRANPSEQRNRSNVPRNIPTSQEIDEFFSNAEQQQQKLFTEKYNFDFVNDLPLPGRYDWCSDTQNDAMKAQLIVVDTIKQTIDLGLWCEVGLSGVSVARNPEKPVASILFR